MSRLAAVSLVAWSNLRARWPRALVALIAVCLGVALVTAVTTGYASARETIKDWNFSWVGYSHVHVEGVPAEIWDNPRLPSSLADRLARIPGVERVVTRMKQQLRVPAEHFPESTDRPPGDEIVYGYGIDPDQWKLVRPAGVRMDRGRMIAAPGEVLIEEHLAEMLGKDVGDEVELVAGSEPMTFRIVGVLTRPRLSSVSSQQVFVLRDVAIMSKPDLEALHAHIAVVEGADRVELESIDLVLSDPTSDEMERVAAAVEALGEYPSVELANLAAAVRRYRARPTEQSLAAIRAALEAVNAHPGADFPELNRAAEAALADPGTIRMLTLMIQIAGARDTPEAQLARTARATQVSTADEQLQRLENNLRMFRIASNMVSIVALLTASYLIFTTMGMGMVQRQAELGMMRCVGAGRLQIAVATIAEAVPVAVIGIGSGLLAGVLAAQWLIARYSTFFTQVVISQRGITWAIAGGLGAVALAVAVPVWLATRVSPLAASRPQARRISLRVDVAVGIVGLVLIALSFLPRATLADTRQGDVEIYLNFGVPALFLGYFLVAPLVVASAGWLLKYFASALMFVRPRLLHDQMQTGRWRTAATFCALMVCVSMLVNLRTHSDAIMKGWKQPVDMPPGMLYFFEGLDRGELKQVESFPEIDAGRTMPIMAFWVRFQTARMTGDESLVGRVLAGPIDRFDQLIDLKFIEIDPSIECEEGKEAEAVIARVQQGGAFIATREFSARQGVGVGDTVRFWRDYRGRGVDMKIVAIVESPTMDMAIDFLNIRDRFRNMAAGTVVGTVRDANSVLASGYGMPRFDPNDPSADRPWLTSILMFDFDEAKLTEAGGADPEKPEAAAVAQAQLLERIGARIELMEDSKRLWSRAKTDIHKQLEAAAAAVNKFPAGWSAGTFESADDHLARARTRLDDAARVASPGERQAVTAAIARVDAAVAERRRAFEAADNPSSIPPPEKVDPWLGVPLGNPEATMTYWAGSLRELTDMVLGEFRSTVSILQKIALWATAIAALGVGFAMAANVQSRRRQLAVLRAVGMTQFQLTRLVLAEAITIALIGCFLGIVQGHHLARNASWFDKHVFGFETHVSIQGMVILMALGFSVVCCLVASVLPALRAGRTNILAAMRQV